MPHRKHDSSDDESVDDESFNTFLAKVKSQEKSKKKKRRVEERNEQSLTVSEYNVTKAQEPISLENLLGTLKDTRQQAAVKQQLTAHKAAKKALPAPLHKFQADKVKRTVSYENVKNQLQKWQSIVEDFRTSDHLEFPLKNSSVSFHPVKDTIKNYKPISNLEQEVYSFLDRTGYAVDYDAEETEEAMDLEEALRRKDELSKLRARQSYYTAKARWQKKIKSKRYRNIKKKERLRQQASEAESQVTTNPDAAADKMKRLEELRALERASLRHKNTTKWAKFQITAAKYDKRSKDALQDQIELGQQLSKKHKPVIATKSSSDESESDSDSDDGPVQTNSNKVHFVDSIFNDIETFAPKTSHNTRAKDDCVKQVKSILRKSNNSKPTEKTVSPLDEDITAGLKINTSEMIDASTIRKNTMEDFSNFDEGVSSSAGNAADDGKTYVGNGTPSSQREGSKKKKEKEPELDPRKFITIDEKVLRSRVPKIASGGDDLLGDSSDDEDLRMTIAEAFAEDDVVAEFEESKKEEVEREEVKDIDLVLPGWGCWGGPNIAVSQHKKDKFIIKAPKGPPRKDYLLGHMIISERKDKKLAAHKVKELPWQFVSVPAFEESISAPVGRNWNAETAYKQLVEPKISTKLGTIIEPMDAEALVNKLKPSRQKANEKRTESKIPVNQGGKQKSQQSNDVNIGKKRK